ncbi:PaaX family transcriptional regulator [Rhodococcus globerulus]|uniref:PaaX family transcriptional regulator n=1 Tax=Rhodococcus globerulus TaxID=33008 RepID=UPI0015862895|nr:PaaX family transcriptional regulator C-terminal domain-containing protein [Rhodococcus globerulus]
MNEINRPVPAASRASGESASVMPQQLMLAFLGTFVVDRDRDVIAAKIYLELFGYLGVSESATRATLNRMVRSGLLTRVQVGRTASFGISERGEKLLREGGARVTAANPFAREDSGWTLLSYTIPEARRDLRHQLRSQLLWAGFGRLRDGLWIAPGVVDTQELLSGLGTTDVASFAFAGNPLPGTSPADFVADAWDLAAIEAEHRQFIDRWTDSDAAPENPLAAHTALVADWLRLLRGDPGLPTQYLPRDWPAETSTATYAKASQKYSGPAEEFLSRMIGQSGNRR